MDTLHTVLRSLRGETKARRDHLSVFREFLQNLDRIGRSRNKGPRALRGKPNGERRSGRRNGAG
jgi:hypothetical protein